MTRGVSVIKTLELLFFAQCIKLISLDFISWGTIHVLYCRLNQLQSLPSHFSSPSPSFYVSICLVKEHVSSQPLFFSLLCQGNSWNLRRAKGKDICQYSFDSLFQSLIYKLTQLYKKNPSIKLYL